MPNIKSVKKDVLRSRKRRLINQAAKSQIKTVFKKARTAIAAHKAVEEVTPLVTLAVSTVDRAFKRGILHRNAAARRKSRLMKAANAAKA